MEEREYGVMYCRSGTGMTRKSGTISSTVKQAKNLPKWALKTGHYPAVMDKGYRNTVDKWVRDIQEKGKAFPGTGEFHDSLKLSSDIYNWRSPPVKAPWLGKNVTVRHRYDPAEYKEVLEARLNGMSWGQIKKQGPMSTYSYM